LVPREHGFGKLLIKINKLTINVTGGNYTVGVQVLVNDVLKVLHCEGQVAIILTADG